MASESIALPRARVKRKRKKPMPPHLKYYLFWVLVDALFLYSNVVDLLGDGPKFWPMLLSLFWSGWLAGDWPRFKREWDSWRRDDDA